LEKRINAFEDELRRHRYESESDLRRRLDKQDKILDDLKTRELELVASASTKNRFAVGLRDTFLTSMVILSGGTGYALGDYSDRDYVAPPTTSQGMLFDAGSFVGPSASIEMDTSDISSIANCPEKIRVEYPELVAGFLVNTSAKRVSMVDVHLIYEADNSVSILDGTVTGKSEFLCRLNTMTSETRVTFLGSTNPVLRAEP
jgi:hypothetical protein